MLDLGEQITKAMHEKGMTCADLAQCLGVNPIVVTKVLRGDPSLRLSALFALAGALGKELKISLKEVFLDGTCQAQKSESF